MTPSTQIVVGAALAAGVAALAYALGALTVDGAITAALAGAITFGLGGWRPALLLIVFFVSSSALTRARAEGQARDARQVLANGALPAAFAAVFGLTGDAAWLAAMAGALAASNADTWATEVGMRSGREPRLITTRRPVEAGRSGAVTAIGNLAALAGAGLIGAVAAVLGEPQLLVPCLIGGFAGALVDSLLGATVQGEYRCAACGKWTEEHPEHSCGGTTELERGWRRLGNDGVNFFASAAGALSTWLLWRLPGA